MMKTAIRLILIALIIPLGTAQSPVPAEPSGTQQRLAAAVPPLHEALASVSSEHLRSHVKAIEGVRNPDANPEGLAKAQTYIQTTFRNLGYEVTQHSFSYEQAIYQDVIATRLGTRHPEKRVLVIAHFDSVAGSPGADDNASGVGVLLELASLLKPYRFENTIQFVATNLEEHGLVGSQSLAERAKQEQWQIEGVLVLEMVGYAGSTLKQAAPAGLEWFLRGTGDFLAVVGNEASKQLVERFVAGLQEEKISLPYVPLLVPGNGEFLHHVRRSDHAPFWDAGYPALMLTDTANFRNQHYHHASDTSDTLNFDFSAQVCRAVGELVNALAVSAD